MQNRRHHKIISKDEHNDAATNKVIIDDLPMDVIENDSYFGRLGNEADWMLFTNNLHSIHSSQATFIKTIREEDADKFSVCKSQHKRHVCEKTKEI